jgi:hypothetical protein
MTADSPDTAGHEASDFITKELDAEHARKSSLESRGFAVITTSGALVTLLFALAALVVKASEFALADAPRWLLVGAALLFVLAAALGIACNSPRLYYQVDPRSLEVFVTPEVWAEAGADAKRELTTARLIVLTDARTRNDRKGRLVVAAMILQVAAMLITAIAITMILIKS